MHLSDRLPLFSSMFVLLCVTFWFVVLLHTVADIVRILRASSESVDNIVKSDIKYLG